MTYRIVFTRPAQEMLAQIADRRIRDKIIESTHRLERDPEKQGKPLLGPLAGYRSLRVIGQRFRLIYKVEAQRVLVIIVGVGIRKEGDRHDIYRRLQKLLYMKLL
jgi:mRNA interferase RelE/StbE